MKWITWIEKDGPHLLPGRGQLDHREACIAGGAIVIIHRDLQVRTFQTGIRDIRTKTLTTPPGDLQHAQMGRNSDDSRARTHRRIAAGCRCWGGDNAAREQTQGKENRKTAGMEHLVGWGTSSPRGLNLYVAQREHSP